MPTRLFGGRPTTKEERQLALRIAAVFAVPLTLILVVPLIAAGFLYNRITDDRITDNQESISRVEMERIERTEILNDFVFERCIQAEVRDAVSVAQYRADIKLAKANFPAGPLLNEWIQTRTDGIFALEPPDEPDCTPPPATSP